MRHRFLNRVLVLLLLGLGISHGGIGDSLLWAQDGSQSVAPMGAQIPATAPPGMSQDEWNAEIVQCQNLSAEVRDLRSLPADQLAAQANPYLATEIKNCARMFAPVQNQYQPIKPNSIVPVPAVPTASPTPPEPSNNDTSSNASSKLNDSVNSTETPTRRVTDFVVGHSNVQVSNSSQSNLTFSEAVPALSSLGTIGPISNSDNAGDDVNACTQELMPPNVSGDVSDDQTAEFTTANLSVWDKEANYKQVLASGSFTNPETQKQFWCGTEGTNGSFLPNCLNSQISFSDTNIVYDRASGQWFATAVPELSGLPQPYIFFASTSGDDATDKPGNWNRWSIDNTTYQSEYPNGLICPVSPDTQPDQPLAGFSATYVAIDTTCYTPDFAGVGLDTAVLIAIQQIKTVPAPSQPTVYLVSNSLPFRSTPSRDRSAGGYENLWLESAFLPNAPPAAAPTISWVVVDSGGQIDTELSGSQTLGLPAGTYVLPPVLQPNCPATYNCQISGGQARITGLDLQVRPSDNTAYLATAFSYAITNGYVAQFSVQPIANPNAIISRYMSSTDGTILGYDTMTIDEDLDAAMTATDLSPIANPAIQWYQNRYYPDEGIVNGLGEGYLQSSGSYPFTGQSSCDINNQPPQHWGDFNSAGWDPTVASPNGKPGVFWTINETTQGGQPNSANPDQNSTWWNISDPLPYYIGDVSQEATSPCKTGTKCTITLAVPSGTQAGDVLLANIGIGENAGTVAKELTLPNSTWTLLPFLNTSGDEPWFTDSVPCGITNTDWLAVHVYAPGDATQFSFSAPAKNYTACGGTFKPAMGGTLITYRDAGHDFPNYNAQGYGSTTSEDSYTFGPIAASQINSGSPPEGTMMLQPAVTSAGTGVGGTEITLAGNPALTLESEDGINDGPFYSGQMSFGPYTTTSNCVPDGNKESCGFLNLVLGMPSY